MSSNGSIALTSWEAKREITPRGINMTLTIKNVEMTCRNIIIERDF